MRTPDVMRMVVLCVCYVATAQFGLSLDALHSVAAAVWPPTGIALMALVLGGCRLWPGITCGAFLANLWAGAPVPVACGIAITIVLARSTAALIFDVSPTDPLLLGAAAALLAVRCAPPPAKPRIPRGRRSRAG